MLPLLYSIGERYTCVVDGKEIFLFYEDNNMWFMERAGAWRIQEKRIEKGITAVDLSTYLNITANQVSRIERGCAGIDIYKLIVICKILGVQLN